MTAVGQRVGARVGHRVGQTLGRASGDPRLLRFSDGAFSRNNGTLGLGGTAAQRSSADTWSDIAADILRTDYGGLAGMFERQVKNESQRSDTPGLLSVAGWTKTDNSTDVTDPLGANTATKFVTTTTGGHGVSVSFTTTVIPNSTTVTHSFWARTDVGTWAGRFARRSSANTYDYLVVNLTTTWTRFVFTTDSGVGATAPGYFLWGAAAGATIANIYVIGWQVEKGAYPTTRKLTTTVADTRWADVMTFPSQEVPAAFRNNGFTCTVRPEWANADLSNGEYRVLCSTDSSNWIGFEKAAGSLYLRCYVGGALKIDSGAITVARDTSYPVICNFATAVITFNGVAGGAGTATALPGGVALRWGGIAGGSSELDGATSEPVSI